MDKRELIGVFSDVYRCMDQLIGVIDDGNCDEIEGLDIEVLVEESGRTLEQIEKMLIKYQVEEYGI